MDQKSATARASVVIIGAGIIGTSIAYHLTQRGFKDILLLEKADSPITGSTARSFAGVRHQFSTKLNIELSKYSIERLKHFTEEVGGFADLRQIGYLFMTASPVMWSQVQKNVALQNSLGIQVELLDATNINRLVPGVKTSDILGASFCADDGYCDPHGIASGYLKRARELGVRLQCNTEVTGFQFSNGLVTGIETTQGLISCETVVNAAGPRAGAIGQLAGLTIPVEPIRRCIYSTGVLNEIPRDIPMTFDMDTGLFFRKDLDYLLFCISNPHQVAGFNTGVDWEWLETVLEIATPRLPILEQADLAQNRCWGGLYETTPDHTPVLGRHPDLPNFVNANGFSGHGVMHAPATGLLIAEEILDKEAHSLNIDPLRIARFHSGRTSNEHNIY